MGRGRLCYRKVTDKILFILQKHNPTLKNESSFVFVICFLSFFFELFVSKRNMVTHEMFSDFCTSPSTGLDSCLEIHLFN